MKVFILLSLLAIYSVSGDDVCTTEYSCSSCTEVRICQNTTSGFKELFRFSCPSATPYCDISGICTAIPPLNCSSTDSFPCMQDGVFPNPSDCQKYHVCENGTSHTITCPSYYNFDSNQGTCVRGAACYTFSCYSKTGTKIAYGNDASIYAYCRDGVAVLVERCSGAFQLNSATQTCGPSCQAVGNKVPDADDCTKYFYCSKEPYASDYTITSEQCPTGSGFDPRYLRCAPLKFLPSCTP